MTVKNSKWENIDGSLTNIIRSVSNREEMTTEEIMTKDFVSDAIFDSISFVSLIVELEEVFDIQIDDEYLLIENMRSFEAIKGMLHDLR